MQLARHISHDIAFEWTGRANRAEDEHVDASFFHVSTEEPAFHVTGRFRPDHMNGTFRADGRELQLFFELAPPSFIKVRLHDEPIFTLNVSTGVFGTERGKLGQWQRKNQNSLEIDGVELARMVSGHGWCRRVPAHRSPRIYWGVPSWTDLEEVIRIAAVIIDSVFYVAPDTRETFVRTFGGTYE